MLDYHLLKTIHIISSTLLFGTGLGTFFFMLMANRSGNVEAVRVTAQTVVVADWIFTTPAVVVQAITGVLLMKLMGFSFTSVWFLLILALFCLVGALWVPVVKIQIELRNIIKNLPQGEPLPPRFKKLMSKWTVMGYPAFGTVVVIFILMVYKPWL